jgi:hypothetical protein
MAMCGMSALESLAKVIWLAEWKTGRLAMLSAAFDAGGSKHDQPVLIVAGFVSTVADWMDFDREWKERLSKEGLDYFHAQRFAQSSGPFKEGWKGNEGRRQALLGDLVDIIVSHAHQKFGSLIVNTIHQAELSEENRKAFYLEAYPLAGRTVVADVVRYAVSFKARAYPEFVFEDGDLDKGKLMQRMKEDGYPPPIFRPKKDTIDPKSGLLIPGYTPLQAADLWAYELLLADRRVQQHGQQDHFRWAFERLNKMAGEAGFYSEKDMDRVDQLLSQRRAGVKAVKDPATGAYLLE